MDKVMKTDPIYLNVFDKMKILLASVYVKICFCRKFDKIDKVMGKNIGKLYKTYKYGKKKIDSDLNIINVIKKLRFLENSVLNHLS